MDFEDISLQNIGSTSCINYPQGSTGYWGKCLTAAAAFFSSLSAHLAQRQSNFYSYSLMHCPSLLLWAHLFFFFPSFYLNFVSLHPKFPCCQPVCLPSALISRHLNLVLTISSSLSFSPSVLPCLVLPIAQIFHSPSAFTPHLLSAAFSLSLHLPADLKIVLATLKGCGEQRTEAWMSAIAGCVWSKALSAV